MDAEIILRAHGLAPAHIKAEYMGPGPAADALRAGKINAFFLVAGPPARAIAELAASTPIALLPVNGKRADGLLKRYPFLSRGSIPAGAYGNEKPIATLTVGAQFVVSADVPETLVFAITRALWHKNARALLDGGHPEGRNIQLDTALKGIGIPLHPGAERYYREAGLLSPDGYIAPPVKAPDRAKRAGPELKDPMGASAPKQAPKPKPKTTAKPAG